MKEQSEKKLLKAFCLECALLTHPQSADGIGASGEFILNTAQKYYDWIEKETEASKSSPTGRDTQTHLR